MYVNSCIQLSWPCKTISKSWILDGNCSCQKQKTCATAERGCHANPSHLRTAFSHLSHHHLSQVKVSAGSIYCSERRRPVISQHPPDKPPNIPEQPLEPRRSRNWNPNIRWAHFGCPEHLELTSFGVWSIFPSSHQMWTLSQLRPGSSDMSADLSQWWVCSPAPWHIRATPQWPATSHLHNSLQPLTASSK